MVGVVDRVLSYSICRGGVACLLLCVTLGEVASRDLGNECEPFLCVYVY